MNRNVRNYILGGLAAATLIAVAACGGAGSPGAPYPSVAGAGATSLPSTGSATITMPQGSGLGVGTVQVKGSGTLTASQSVTAPSAVTPMLKTRSSATVNSSGGNTPVAYVTLTASSTATISQLIVSVSSTSSLPSGTYYLAFWNGTQWVTVGSPATVSGNVVTVNSGTITPALSLATGASLYLAVYTGQIFTTPPPPPVASPSALTLSEGLSGTINVISGTGITIQATSSNTSVATVTSSASTGTENTATFTVTAQLATGTATITFTDPFNQKTTATVTVNNTAPTPIPAPSVAAIGLGYVAGVGITGKSNTQITIATTNGSVAEIAAGASGALPSPTPAPPSVGSFGTSSVTVTTDGSGKAYFWVYAAASGVSNITLTDPYSNVGTMQVTVSAIINGGFANGLTGWAPCSYQHTALTTPVDAASPLPNTPEPAQTSAATAPVALASISPLVTVAGTPPTNDNPGYPSAGSITQSGITYTSPGSAPAVLGSDVALVGTIEASVVPYPKGAFGMCQTVTIPASTPYLSFWVLEGGSDYSFATGDQEAAIFGSYSANVASSLDEYLFAEMDCYLHPTTASPAGTWGGAGVNTDSGCWPSAYGGDIDSYYNWIAGGFWSQRGPYNLSAYAGESVTLFIGNWSYYHDTAAYYAQFLYVGNVQLGATNTFPNNVVYAKGRSLGTITLQPRAAIQSTKPRT